MGIYLRRCTLLLVAWTISSGACGLSQATNDRFKRVDVDAINCIMQDRAGWLWIGTSSGLLRYDSYDMDPVFRQHAAASYLADGQIKCLFEDDQGVLWIGTTHGLNLYDRADQSIERYTLDPNNPYSLPDDSIKAVVQDGHAKIWIATKGGLARMEKPGVFTRYLSDPENARSIASNTVNALELAPDGTLWVGTGNGGLNRWDPERQSFDVFWPPEDSSGSVMFDWINCLSIADDGLVWIGTYAHGLKYFDPRTEQFIEMQQPLFDLIRTKGVRALQRDSGGNMWVGTFGMGALRVAADGSFIQLTHDPSDEMSLSDDRVMALCLDRQNQIWLGTHRGINVWDPEIHRFQVYRYLTGKLDGLASQKVISAGFDRKGSLWVGTYGQGLDRIELVSRQVRHYAPSEQAGGISASAVWDILCDRQDRLWVATSQGIQRYDPGEDRFHSYTHSPDDADSISNKNVLCLAEDLDGMIWLGTWGGGVNRFDPQTAKATRYLPDISDAGALLSDVVQDVEVDVDGAIWVSPVVQRWDPETGLFEAWTDRGLPDDVGPLLIDNRGSFWVGGGKGLWLLNREADQFESILSAQSFGWSHIQSLLARDGVLWINTDLGLVRYDTESRGLQRFDRADGLHGTELGGAMDYDPTNGLMVTGGDEGVSLFAPDSLVPHFATHPVFLTSLLLANEEIRGNNPYYSGDLRYVDQVKLGYGDNFFAFRFAALNYRQPQKTAYAYRLQGVDPDWRVAAADDRKAAYTRIPHGTYRFQVKASDQNGRWDTPVTEVLVTIATPPWLSWWAYLLYGAAAIAAYVYGIKLRRALVAWKKSRFIGSHRVLGLLGEGGMGRVYKVLDLNTKQIMALKMVRRAAKDEASIKRFVNEGLVCERINHPNVVRIFSRGEHDDHMYYTMEYCDGVSLRDLMPHLDVGWSLALFEFLLDLLHELHQAGIVHRDVKPENFHVVGNFDPQPETDVQIMMKTLKQHVKIMDFGISKFMGEETLTQTGELLGTLYYLPAEYFEDPSLSSPGLDFYALGVMLYEMLTGTRPFDGPTPISVITMIVKQKPAPPFSLNPIVNESISNLVVDMIDRDPETRLSTYAGIKQRLRNLTT